MSHHHTPIWCASVAVLALAPFFAAGPVAAQGTRPTMVQGDSTIVAVIRTELQALYPAYRPATGLLTTANPLEQPGAVGTEVHGFEEAGRLSRIVASAWTATGKYEVEYFGAPDEPPRFIFESAVYRDDAPDRPVGRNFWGEPSWERRYYLEGGLVRFTETVGDGARPAARMDVHARRFEALRALILSARAARR